MAKNRTAARAGAVVLALLVAGFTPSPATAAPTLFTDRYDEEIRAAARRWLPGVPWQMWKAQLYQESRLDPNARSPVGAEGIAQFMPGTWREVSQAMGYHGISPRAAGPAIEAGAFYMARLIRSWTAPRPADDRLRLAQASYNAGLGNLLRAQRACGNPAGFDEIMRCLPQITGHHSKETETYVSRIWRWFRMML